MLASKAEFGRQPDGQQKRLRRFDCSLRGEMYLGVEFE